MPDPSSLEAECDTSQEKEKNTRQGEQGQHLTQHPVPAEARIQAQQMITRQ